MREEVRNWWRQSLEDLDSAERNLEIGKYYLVAFLCHQACEKGLKSYLMLRDSKRVLTTHSLVDLGKDAEVPQKVLDCLRNLAPEYTISRYPDVTESLPYENYSEGLATDLLDKAKEVFEWLKQKMKR
ncbi:MAG: HEPN domain-containing protein [Candidatus Pacearchaeota archaeon]